MPINNKYESEAPNIAEDKNNIDLDIDYLESKKTLDEYIIDTGDALFIEFENKFGRLQEKSFISRNPTDINYLKPNTNLDNYLLDEGDTISIKFKKTPSLSTVVSVNKEGEVFLPRIKKAYIRGLTINQLKKILESRYQEYLINPEIEIRIVGFKFIDSGIYKVDLEGEIYLPLIKGTFVRGLTPVELSNLLEKKYKDFDIDAKTSIRVSTFKN